MCHSCRAYSPMTIFMLVACSLLMGCDSGGNEGSTTTTTLINGAFRGTWQSANTINRGTVTAALTHDNDDNIGGNITFTGSPCFANGRIDGNIDQSHFEADIEFDNGQGGSIVATVSAVTAITGTYAITGGQCTDQGSFALSKVGGSSSPSPPTGGACCRVCTTGKACGDTCIAASDTCRVGAGCACNG